MNTHPRNRNQAAALLVCALGLSLSSVLVASTADARQAPHGAALAILLSGAILPAVCTITAARELQ